VLPRLPAWVPRAALLSTVVLWWLNFLLTSRWAAIPGSIRGPKQWLFVPALVVSTVLVLRARRSDPVVFQREARVLAGLCGLGFLDNWPARFQSTVDGIALLKRGALAGWQWAFLGGYHTSSDLTVTLTIPALIPMLLLGDRLGFHLAHLMLFVSLPVLVWWDLSLSRGIRADDAGLDPDIKAGLPALAFAIVCVTTAGFSYYLLRSGDTNSLAGVAATLLALVGSHASAQGRRGGPAALVGGMALVTYCHAGFFLYASVLLIAEAIYYCDRSRLLRALIAIGAGVVAGLPLTWESWRYPDLFIYNNVLYEPVRQIDWLKVARKIYYNVEILFLPGRWFNDFTGLAGVFLPVLLVTLAARRSRAGFYAAGALVVIGLLRLNAPEFGYAFHRPIHLLAVLVPPAIAAFLLRHGTSRLVVGSLVMTILVYLQVLARPVPHVDSLESWQPALVARLRGLDGNLVLVENTYHRDMIAAEGQESEDTPFEAHFQSLIPAATGKRLYAGVWDGWQWSPFRSHLVAGGAWRGKAIGDWPVETFVAELRKWGIRHLLVVHEPTKRYLTTTGFFRHADAGPFAHFELANADARSVTTTHGDGRLTAWDPLGGTLALHDVRAGDRVVVRTHAHPAWHARVARTGAPVPVLADAGQLAFDAPASGSYDVQLEYPARRGLLLGAGFALLLGVGMAGQVGRHERQGSA
jgi:hypothetical protein